MQLVALEGRMKVRDRLRKRLEQAGWTITSSITGAVGHYRINAKWDDTIVCWETTGQKPGERFAREVRIISWDTMTECARYGIEVDEYADGDGFIFEALARLPTRKESL